MCFRPLEEGDERHFSADTPTGDEGLLCARCWGTLIDESGGGDGS